MPPNDAQFITGEVPDAMREGVELDRDAVAPPTRMIQDVDGQPAQLIQHRFPRPDHIPAGPPKVSNEPSLMLETGRSPAQMSYDFPLLPGVQCRVTLQVLTGELKADHLEQLVSLLTSHTVKLREQESRSRWLQPPIPDECFLGSPKPKRGRPKKESVVTEALDGTER